MCKHTWPIKLILILILILIVQSVLSATLVLVPVIAAYSYIFSCFHVQAVNVSYPSSVLYQLQQEQMSLY